MQAACLRHTDIPHTTRLFLDFLYQFPQVADFYGHNHSEAAAYDTAAAEIRFPDDRRAALVAALRQQNGDSPQLDLLSKTGAVAVVTGQQVGLFSGPCYTIYKALTAIRLAADLNARGIPAAPVFWLATEDHDFAEVNHCWSFTAAQEAVSLSLPGDDGNQQPVGAIRPASYPLDALRNSLAGHPYGEEVTAAVSASYAPGVPMGDAFQALLTRLLGSHKLLFLNPLQPAVRAIAAPLLRRAVEVAADLFGPLLERSRALEHRGYHAQVLVEPHTSLFFLLENGRRQPLRRQGADYLANGRKMAASELAARAEQLSPNVLLRPVVQDYLLPTIACVGGPAELAYLAQSEVLYRSLLGRAPVAAPRAGFTILDARAAKLIERYQLPPTCCFHGLEALRETIAGRLTPTELRAEMDSATGATQEALVRLRSRLSAMDATLAAALDKSAAKIAHQLSKIEGKVAREALRRDRRAEADAAHIYGLVYPNKHLQERFYSILPFLARHGPALIDQLYEQVSLLCPDHVVCHAG